MRNRPNSNELMDRNPNNNYYLVCHDNKPKEDAKAGYLLPRLGVVNSETGEYEMVSLVDEDPLTQSKDLESLCFLRENEYLICESSGRCYHVALNKDLDGYSANTLRVVQLPVPNPKEKFFNLEAVTVTRANEFNDVICYSHRGGINPGEEPWTRCALYDINSGKVGSFNETSVENPFAIHNRLNRAISDSAYGEQTKAFYFVATIDTEGSEGIAATTDKSYSFIYTNEYCVQYIENKKIEALYVNHDETQAIIVTDNDKVGTEKICRFSLYQPDNTLNCHAVPYGIGGIAPVSEAVLKASSANKRIFQNRIINVFNAFGYNKINKQLALVKLTAYRGCFGDDFKNKIIPDHDANKLLFMQFTTLKEGIEWWVKVTQDKLLRASFFKEGVGKDKDPIINVNRWLNTSIVNSVDDEYQLLEVFRTLGLVDTVEWPTQKIEHVVIHGAMEMHVIERVNFLKDFKGNLYYLSNARGLFNDEISLAPILASRFNKSEAFQDIQVVLDNNKNSTFNWLQDLNGLQASILKKLNESQWPIAKGWYHNNSDIYDQAAQAEGRQSLAGWPTALDMVQYRIEQRKMAEPEKFKNINLVAVLSMRAGRVANTADNIADWYRQHGMHLPFGTTVVFVSSNSRKLHYIGYQDVIMREVLSKLSNNTNHLNTFTVGPGTSDISLSAAADVYAKTFYAKKSGVFRALEVSEEDSREQQNELGIYDACYDFADILSGYVPEELISDFNNAAKNSMLFTFVLSLTEESLFKYGCTKSQIDLIKNFIIMPLLAIMNGNLTASLLRQGTVSLLKYFNFSDYSSMAAGSLVYNIERLGEIFTPCGLAKFTVTSVGGLCGSAFTLFARDKIKNYLSSPQAANYIDLEEAQLRPRK